MSTGVPTTAQVMRQARDENFPVAFRFLPPRLRRDLKAIYGYARLVDDIGDELEGDREAALAAVEADLDRIDSGEEPLNETLKPIGRTIRERRLPREPLQKLIEANRVDQQVSSYLTYDDLLGYCELSANPVGRLVLHVLGAATPERIELSDHVCSALQLVEFWQDVCEDRARARVYVPVEDLHHFDVAETDLQGAETPVNVRMLIAFEARRARRLLEAGAPLVHTLSGWGRVVVAGYVGGGLATLDALEAAEFEVVPVGPKAAKGELLRATWRVLRSGPEGDG